MASLAEAFLTRTYGDLWRDFEAGLTSQTAVRWDYVVITASNAEQAEAFRQQIASRTANGRLPGGTRYLCVPDRDGARVGSGGATLGVLKAIAELEPALRSLRDLRVLLIHSGGDSKRIPQYSACGKLFSPVPRVVAQNQRDTLFDEFVALAASLPERIPGGVVVVSGDVLLLFSPSQIFCSGAGAVAMSTKVPVDIGVEHGVFLADDGGEVVEFLHKQPEDALRARGAISRFGTVDLDIGFVWLSGHVIDALWGAISVDGQISPEKYDLFVNEQARLSFYGDFLYPLASHSTLEQYLREAPEFRLSDELLECRRQLWPLLHQFKMTIRRLAPARFIHFGTTAELRALMTDQLSTFRCLGWQQSVISNIPPNSQYSAIDSFVAANAVIGEGTYLEDSRLSGGCQIGKRCVISNLDLQIAVTIPDDIVVHVLPVLGNKFCARVFHVDDNPKKCALFGTSLTSLIDFYGLPIDKLFDGTDQTLWSAKLYSIVENQEELVASINFLIQFVNRSVSPSQISKWLDSPRNSLGFLNADTARILDWQAEIEDIVRVAAFVDAMNEVSLEKAKKHLGRGKALFRQLSQINAIAKTSPLFLRIRLYKAISVLLDPILTIDGRTPSEFEDLCYSELSRETCEAFTRVQLGSGEPVDPVPEVTIEAPIRVNWAGGWSDTPPYCYEFGGTILNVAVSLKGKLPLKATAKRIANRVIIFESIDTGHRQEFADFQVILDCANPADPFALHKSVLLISGVLTREAQLTIEGGIYLGTSANVPKGSGLGTSSILAGACLQALAKVRGRQFTINEISTQILCVEQLMSTGGGWQDQIGGLVSGIKLAFTRPGIIQTVVVDRLSMTDEALAELNDRFALIYTGQQRLARNLLREVVGLVLVRDERSMEILLEIQRLAVTMKFELERGRITEFAKLLKRHWDIIVELDPGTTNTCIDFIFKCCEDLIDGQFIAGAGGGGFLEVILKKGVTKEQLAERLGALWQDSGVGIWETKFV